MKRRSFFGAVIGSLFGGAIAGKAVAESVVEPQSAADFLNRKSENSVFRRWPDGGAYGRDILATCRWDNNKQRWELLTLTLICPAEDYVTCPPAHTSRAVLSNA